MKPFKLDSVSKIETGFKIPDNYFENIKIDFNSTPEITETKIVTFSKKWRFLAAAMIVIGLSIPIFNHYIVTSKEVDPTTISNYLNYGNALSDNDFATILDEKDIQNLQINYKLDDKSIENELLNNTNLEQYIEN